MLMNESLKSIDRSGCMHENMPDKHAAAGLINLKNAPKNAH